MAAFAGFLESHHMAIMLALVLVIVALAASCLFHEALPICHYIFGCDHGLHPGRPF